MNENNTVLLDQKGDVVHLILNRPDKRNAINEDIANGLYNHLLNLERDPDVRAIVLRGAGAMFSSGIDATWLGQIGANFGKSDLGLFVRQMIAKIQGLNNLIERIEKPVIAMLHGRCIGLALEIALACDFRIATDDCLVSMPEVLLGLVPDCGGTTRVTRMAGPAVAKEVVMYCETETAQRYYEWNLINRVCPADQLEKTVADFIAVLNDRPPRTLGLAKRLIDQGAGLSKTVHMEMEAYVNSSLLTDPEFPQILMSGFQKLRGK